MGYWLSDGSDGDGGHRPDSWFGGSNNAKKSNTSGGACLMMLVVLFGVPALITALTVVATRGGA